LVPEKAPDLLIRAFARVKGDVRLIIAGSSGFTDVYAESLQRLAASDKRVIFAGGVYGDELAELYSNASAFVLPSSLEGLPITLLEALAHQAPVIVSDIAPHLEVVGEDGPGHRVVRQGDLDALAAAMTAVLLDRASEVAGAEALSPQVAEAYSWDAAAIATERVYARVLDLRASSRVPGRTLG
jgi:glycosyltransferase involved in cell wall biosynthesis